MTCLPDQKITCMPTFRSIVTDNQKKPESGTDILYSDCCFSCESIVINKPIPNLSNIRWNDKVESFKANGMKVSVFTDAKYKGSGMTYKNLDIECLPDNIRGKVASINDDAFFFRLLLVFILYFNCFHLC